MQDLADGLGRIVAALRTHFGDTCLAPPANPKEIEAFEARLGLELPEALKNSYRISNGEGVTADPSGFIGLFSDYEFLSIEQALQVYEQWTEIQRSSQAFPDLANEEFDSVPEAAIANTLWQPGWVPFAGMGSGNHLAVDLAPGPRGTPGQVINFGADDRVHFVLAPSFEAFLQWQVERYERGVGHRKLTPSAPLLYDELCAKKSPRTAP